MTDWDSIVAEHGPVVFATAWRVLGHAADTEDVVQEVFAQAHRMARAGPIVCWRGLRRRLASHRALDRLRRRRPTAPLNGHAPAGPGDDPEAVAVGRELARRLREAVARLPRREAEVFCLRYFDDLSYEQIAESLNMRPGAVGVALHKARARLEALLLQPVQGE